MAISVTDPVPVLAPLAITVDSSTIEAMAGWDLMQAVPVVFMGGAGADGGAQFTPVMFEILRELLAAGGDFNAMPEDTWRTLLAVVRARFPSSPITDNQFELMACVAGNFYEHGYSTVFSRVNASRQLSATKPLLRRVDVV